MTDRKFPIGPFTPQESYSPEDVSSFIQIIENTPSQLRKLVENRSDEELTKTYREDSWNIRQIVHHISDIQYLHYFRMKKAITEPDNDEMTLINMNEWSATTDSLTAPVADSLLTFEAITTRYMFLARTLTEDQLAIRYYHPVRKIWFTQKDALAISAWHVQHHLGHVRWALGIG